MKYTFLTAMLVCSSFIHAGIRPADGLWGTTDDPAIGSGLMLTTQGGITVASVFTYDQDGNNAWYIASGQVDEEGVFEAVLRQTQNGTNITSDIPETAEFVEQTRNLRLEFSGSQRGSFTIDSSEAKLIRPQHFGKINTYNFPDIAGQWVIASSESKKSYIFDLVNTTILTSVLLPPTYLVDYDNKHPSTVDWEVGCAVGSFDLEKCYFNAGESGEWLELDVTEQDIGNQHMLLTAADGEKYQAFRLNKDRRLLPNDGLWRAYDDPAIGSGMAMRTQGDYTVVLVYTYDDEGVPIWKIAAGQFDENGHFSAELLIPTGGTAIENQLPTTASFSDQVQTLEIQLQGTELATFSIEGSAPKFLQNFNFGVNVLQTENYSVNEGPFYFPDLIGQWVGVDYSNDLVGSNIIYLGEYSAVVSPRPPGRGLLYSSDSLSSVPLFDFLVSFTCTRELLQFNSLPYCEGYYYHGNDDITANDNLRARVYYQDIGFNQFHLYVDTEDDLSRESPLIEFFRLDDN